MNWTQEEKLEYNKRCTEFLKLKTLKTAGNKILYDIKNLPEITIPVGSRGINETVKTPLLFATVEQLAFHSDWNWIMEVIEAIEKTPSTQINLIGNHCRIASKGIDFEGFNKQSKKESVVQAINQFLIWYNENKNEIN